MNSYFHVVQRVHKSWNNPRVLIHLSAIALQRSFISEEDALVGTLSEFCENYYENSLTSLECPRHRIPHYTFADQWRHSFTQSY